MKKEVTQLKKALRQSKDLFKKLFDASSNSIAILTRKERRILAINKAGARFAEFEPEEVIGKNLDDTGIFADPEQKDLLLRKMEEEGRVHEFKLRVRTKDGGAITVLHYSDPITFNDEPCFLCISIDVTDREKEASALKESEEKYRTLVENSLQGLAILQDRRIVFCNNTFAEIVGYSVDEVLALSPEGVNTLIHSGDQARLWNRHVDRLAGKAVPSHYEHRAVRKDGTGIWVEGRATLMEYQGKPAIQATYIDVTERKIAEQKLRESKLYLDQIINCISDSIFVIDRDHKFIVLNDATCQFTGRSRDELIGRTGDHFIPKEELQPQWEKDEIVFTEGKETVAEERLVDLQGNLRTFMTKRSLLTNHGGNKQMVAVSRDITEYKRLQAQFVQAQKMEAIGVLAGGIAHDFNNLLTVIRGYTEMLMSELSPEDPNLLELDQIMKAGNQATSLISQLLAFSRKQILQPAILNLNETVADMIVMLRRLIGEDIKLETRIQPGLGLIKADSAQIQQIIMNLAVNARDAMPKGGMLMIETANVDLDEPCFMRHPFLNPGAYVMMAISDNGIGMDAETQAHIFEPFFTTKVHGKGTGLGLSTVYGIVKQSEGFILPYSEPGKGTTFKIYFPRVEGKAAVAAIEETAKLEHGGVGTILVVEDDPMVRALACRILSSRGYDILEAEDGLEALKIARNSSGHIDLVLTDAVMPGMSGKEMLSKIEEFRPGIKSLYISGYTDDAIVHHGILDSGVAFLQKPFTIGSLTRKVREIIDS